MSRLLLRVRRRLSVLLVPLSIVPFAAVIPAIVKSGAGFERTYQSGPLPAPAAGLTAAERAAFTPFAVEPGRIPVLAWHGIGPARDGYTTSQRQFAREIALLGRLGFRSVSMAQYAAFRQGRPVALPAKPVLLTFDDGRLDSYRGADAVLARAHMRAAMFVITGDIEAQDPFYLRWNELHAMARSGRWDVEPHAHEGHVQVAMDAAGHQAPFYAARRYLRSTGRESLADWEARTSADLFAARDRLLAQGFRPHAFAVPFGDDGRRTAGDPRLQGLLDGVLTRQFGTFFVQDDDNDPGWTAPGAGAAQRYELRTSTTLGGLDGWLRRHATTTHSEKR
jgi:polysaccharide deacetylase